MKILEVKNIVKTYGRLRAVDNVSFEINKGEIFGLLGPNGAGKTTLISSIMTLEPFDEGQVKVCGLDNKKNPRQVKTLTGFMPQELVYHGYFNVSEVIQFYSGFCGVWPSREKTEQLLKRLFLWDKRNQKVRSLSGGMKRRVMLAKALIHSPRLLLLDEPTAGVDIGLRNEIWKLIRELRDEGASILFTTHYLEEAEKLCDRVAFIHHGKIRETDETGKLIARLTARHVSLKLKKSLPKGFSHPHYAGSGSGGSEMFLLPHSASPGNLLKELLSDELPEGQRLKPGDILDMKIKEGSLEDVFQKILKSKNA